MLLDPLFSNGDLSNALRTHSDTTTKRVESIPQDQFLNSSDEDLVQHVLSALKVEPLVLHEEQKEMTKKEITISSAELGHHAEFMYGGVVNLPGIEVTVSMPYTGDENLWKLLPSTRQGIVPRGDIMPRNKDGVGSLEIVIRQPTNEPTEQIKASFDSQMDLIRFYLGAQSGQIQQFNAQLPRQILSIVTTRRERLKKHEGLESLLGIPLKRHPDAPPIAPLKIERKLVRPLPPSPKSGVKAEPGITDQDYEHILAVIRHEGRTFESTPKTYAVHNEEELRDILLAHLNGHYMGSASGETFRRSGKTDIRIEDDNRAAFVAECKIWRGTQEMSQAIEQLLGYLTWRDCKAALIVLNKNNAKFTELLSRVPDALKAHTKFVRETPTGKSGEWRFTMTSREDEGRQVQIHVFVFNLFAS